MKKLHSKIILYYLRRNKILLLNGKIITKSWPITGVINENVIGVVKRFKIIADKYRNRRKRFSLRFYLIAYNRKRRHSAINYYILEEYDNLFRAA